MEFNLSDVSQDQFNAAESEVIALLKEKYPNLDLKKGTVLRELLVKPDAEVYALNTDRNAYVQDQLSLLQISQMENPDEEMVNRILSNYNVTRRIGTKAVGQIIVKVANDDYYTLYADTAFIVGGLYFYPVQQYSILPTTETPDPGVGEFKLSAATDNEYYYFIISAQAAEAGTEYMLSVDTTMEMEYPLFGYISSTTYSDFVGGTDSETIEQLIERFPEAIANRGLDSYLSISSFIRNNFSGVTDVSVIGMGEPEQIRDRHNVFGISMGGRVDVYPKSFVYPNTVVVEKEATRIEDFTNSWTFTITSADAPGFYMVKSVTDADSASSLGSYSFVESRGQDPAVTTYHDFALDNIVVETAYTVYQQSEITVTDVPTSASTTRKFRVEVYAAPSLAEIQSLIDSPVYRNKFSDYVVRSPIMCLVSIRTTIHQKTNYPPIDVEAVKTDLANYINNTGFGHVMTKAQISAVLQKYPIIKVSVDDKKEEGMVLQAKLRDAAGNFYTLQGDILDVNTLNMRDLLVSSKTALFVCDKKNLFINIVRG